MVLVCIQKEWKILADIICKKDHQENLFYFRCMVAASARITRKVWTANSVKISTMTFRGDQHEGVKLMPAKVSEIK